MNVFETATQELRLMYHSSDLRNLEQISGDYYRAMSENVQLAKVLPASLSQDALEIINKMNENFATKETLAGEIYYNQGFSDAIQLLMQSMTWKPIRR